MKYRGRGQSLVEFALVLPFLIVIIMGIIDFGYFIYSYSELENATRRASEFLSKTDASLAACQTAAKREAKASVLFSGSDPSTFMTVTTIPASNPKPGGTVKVTFSNYPMRWLTPVGGTFFKNAKFNFTSQRVILNTGAPFSGAC